MSLQILSLRRALERMDEAGELARFYRAMGVSLSAGLPVTTTLELFLGPEAEAAAHQRAGHLSASISRGGTLAAGARAGRFIELEIAFIELGEQTGRLDSTLAALATFFEADHRLALIIKTQTVKMLINPVAGCFILPAPLFFKLGFNAYLSAVVPALGVVLAGAGTFALWRFDDLRSQPRFAVARMLWGLAIAIEAGLPIQRAVQLAAAALGPCSTSTALLQVPALEWQSRPLSETLGRACRLPRNALMAIKNMELTGNTTGTLRWMAQAFEDGTLS